MRWDPVERERLERQKTKGGEAECLTAPGSAKIKAWLA